MQRPAAGADRARAEEEEAARRRASQTPTRRRRPMPSLRAQDAAAGVPHSRGAPPSAQVHAGTLAAQMLKIAQAVAAVAAGVVEEAFRGWCFEQARFLIFVLVMPIRHAMVSRSGCCALSCPKACRCAVRGFASLTSYTPRRSWLPSRQWRGCSTRTRDRASAVGGKAPVHLLSAKATIAKAKQYTSATQALTRRARVCLQAPMAGNIMDNVPVDHAGCPRMWSLEPGTGVVAAKPGEPCASRSRARGTRSPSRSAAAALRSSACAPRLRSCTSTRARRSTPCTRTPAHAPAIRTDHLWPADTVDSSKAARVKRSALLLSPTAVCHTTAAEHPAGLDCDAWHGRRHCRVVQPHGRRVGGHVPRARVTRPRRLLVRLRRVHCKRTLRARGACHRCGPRRHGRHLGRRDRCDATGCSRLAVQRHRRCKWFPPPLGPK
jgi:hypothetical protein